MDSVIWTGLLILCVTVKCVVSQESRGLESCLEEYKVNKDASSADLCPALTVYAHCILSKPQSSDRRKFLDVICQEYKMSADPNSCSEHLHFILSEHELQERNAKYFQINLFLYIITVITALVFIYKKNYILILIQILVCLSAWIFLSHCLNVLMNPDQTLSLRCLSTSELLVV